MGAAWLFNAFILPALPQRAVKVQLLERNFVAALCNADCVPAVCPLLLPAMELAMLQSYLAEWRQAALPPGLLPSKTYQDLSLAGRLSAHLSDLIRHPWQLRPADLPARWTSLLLWEPTPCIFLRFCSATFFLFSIISCRCQTNYHAGRGAWSLCVAPGRNV